MLKIRSDLKNITSIDTLIAEIEKAGLDSCSYSRQCSNSTNHEFWLSHYDGIFKTVVFSDETLIIEQLESMLRSHKNTSPQPLPLSKSHKLTLEKVKHQPLTRTGYGSSRFPNRKR